MRYFGCSFLNNQNKMYLLQCVCLTFGLLVLAFAFKSETWPPQALVDACDVVNAIKKSYNLCHTDPNEIRHFELTTDLKNLPNSTELKCYFYHFMETCRVFKPNSTRLDIAFMMDVVEQLPREQQDIVFGLGRGCVRRIQHMKDPYEIAYSLNVCSKTNDMEHYYFYY